ncbi:MAG TPA: hypothetical protein VKO18_19615 [Terriglobia bacterium]|nr:hypothetical protein [Terriglobia bacterium]
MKIAFLVLVSLTTAALLTGSGGEPAVTYIDHEKVAAALANNGSLVKASDLLVLAVVYCESGSAEGI